MKIPCDYIERCYAGWLGKLIGIRYGAPTESWTYEQIQKIHGEMNGYVLNYKMFAADDDSNGPMLFIRALRDANCNPNITAEEIGKAWLNYAPFEHGFFWWGGYGISTEHTAYLNLLNGIPAPMSGSADHNGMTMAEQIGGQIFIDTWGLVCPGNPTLAAELAGKAASVSHDRNGIYGGQFIASMIAAAFIESDVRRIIEIALEQIPPDCEYARVVHDVIRFFEQQPHKEWREAFLYVKEHWGYSLYPGHCHIIPNAAVVILSLLYGNGDFDCTLNICNMCGWDTDCNVGNVGTIMGVLCGIDKIDYQKWREPINDIFAVSSVLGCLNLPDVPWCIAYLANIAYNLAGETLPVEYTDKMDPNKQLYHFMLPGSTHGFYTVSEAGGHQEVYCANTGNQSLKAGVADLFIGESFRVAKRTYLSPKDMYDNRYDPAFSPLVYPGQSLHVLVKALDTGRVELEACLYVHDRRSGEYIEGNRVKLYTDKNVEMLLQIPSAQPMLIDEIGLRVYGVSGLNVRHSASFVELNNFEVFGNANYSIDFKHEEIEFFNKSHSEVSQFTHWKGYWTIEDGLMLGSCADCGAAFTGDLRWKDYSFYSTILPKTIGKASMNFRVQGAMRSYAVSLEGNKVLLEKINFGRKLLSQYELDDIENKEKQLCVKVKGNHIIVYCDQDKVIECVDTDNPYLNGCVGYSIDGGASALFSDFFVRSTI